MNTYHFGVSPVEKDLLCSQETEDDDWMEQVGTIGEAGHGCPETP